MPDYNSTSLSGKTLRSSKQRQAILDIVTQQHAHLSAEEIYQAVKLLHPSISLGTVYRNLDILTETGAIYRASFADGRARYEMSALGHHHHLVCLKCGKIEDILQCPMAKEMETFIDNYDFQPMHHYFEIYGHCGKCRR